jgi:hypothetical protein
MKKSSLRSLLDDPEVDRIVREAEEELRRLTPAQRRDLFGTEFLPPSPEEFLPVNLEEEDEVPFLF